MAQRRHKLFSKQPFKWLMKRAWGRKLLFLFFGKKKDKKNAWPAWVAKTDEERCQNMPWLFPGTDEEYIATEKIDGTSTTFTMKGFGRKREFYICSRNVVFDKPDKKCYYETNVYVEMAEKYKIEDNLSLLLDHDCYLGNECINNNNVFVTLQGETYGEGIQKRDYGLNEHRFMAFNLIIGYADGSVRRFNPREMTEILTGLEIPCVPIVDEHFKIPATCDDLLELAGGASQVDGGMREGLVFRSYDGTKSFKAVDNNFLLKYHG
jgi:RNA ligase (TIGR02306 family)